MISRTRENATEPQTPLARRTRKEGSRQRNGVHRAPQAGPTMTTDNDDTKTDQKRKKKRKRRRERTTWTTTKGAGQTDNRKEEQGKRLTEETTKTQRHHGGKYRGRGREERGRSPGRLPKEEGSRQRPLLPKRSPVRERDESRWDMRAFTDSGCQEEGADLKKWGHPRYRKCPLFWWGLREKIKRAGGVVPRCYCLRRWMDS